MGEISKALMFTWDVNLPNNPRVTSLPEVYLQQCGSIEVSTTVEEADFVLFHGSEVWYRGPSHDSTSLSPFITAGTFDNAVHDILQQCVERELPAICANPDYIVQTPSGDGIAHMPGKLANYYEELGGTVTWFGKPGVEHFEACVAKLGLDKNRVAH
eukprot:11916927-Ditylum_brightwellii.AAC.1